MGIMRGELGTGISMTKQEYELKEIQLFAGEQADGKPVMENLRVIEPQEGVFQLYQSPGFMRGIAKGDQIKVDHDTKSYSVLKRSGNLCIRVFAKQAIENLAGNLVPALEKLGGSLDYQNERMLVFSIHVSCGFQAIEQLLNEHVGKDGQSAWFYGNVYLEKDGELQPMNWWQSMLKPE
ncbi:protein of unknown function [Alteromonadaceae bacterium Bs31]|nr:protein of unknown function [Alteromonadaceae bacterium Bs31]